MVLRHSDGARNKKFYIFPAVVTGAQSCGIDCEIANSAPGIQGGEIVRLQALVLEIAGNSLNRFIQRRAGQIMKSSFSIQNDHKQICGELCGPVVDELNLHDLSFNPDFNKRGLKPATTYLGKSYCFHWKQLSRRVAENRYSLSEETTCK